MQVDHPYPLREVSVEEFLKENDNILNKIADEMDALAEIMEEFPELLADQREDLAHIQKKTYETVQEVKEAADDLQDAYELKKKNHRFIVYSSAGGLTGTALGTAGFLINPVVGGITIVASTALGFTLGGIWSQH